MKKSFFIQWQERGIDSGDPIERKIAISAYNLFFGIALVVFFSYALVYYFIGAKLLMWNILSGALTLIFTNLIFKIKTSFLLLRMSFYLVTLYVVSGAIAIIGLHKGVEINLLAVVATLPVIFLSTEKKWMQINIAMTFSIYLFLHFLHFEIPEETAAFVTDGIDTTYFIDFNFYTTALVIAFCLILAKEQNAMIQTELDIQRASIANSSRLVALGEMAGGIAHEMNSPLAVIISTTDQLISRQNENRLDPEFLKRSLERSSKMAHRISNIINSLRKLARGESEALNQNELVRNLFEETRVISEEKLKNANIKLEIMQPSQPVWISCKPEQMLQVLVNLLNNAIDATENLPERWVKIGCELKPGIVEISVTDSGSGIPPEVADKIFNPFFTTKPVGKGTGLGLSISSGIISKFNGKMTVDHSCKNTKFLISLPEVKIVDVQAEIAKLKASA